MADPTRNPKIVTSSTAKPVNPTDGPSTDTAIGSYDAIQHSLAYNGYTNLLPNISAREPYGRLDYETFREDEAIPRKYNDMVKAIDSVYYNLAIVRNIVDLMSDFASQGIRIVHPVPSVQRFYQNWFKKVNGQERSERFLSNLYRHGMVAINISDGTLRKKEAGQMSKAAAVSGGTIPLKYNFMHPALVKKKGGLDNSADAEYVYVKPRVHGRVVVPGTKEIPLDKDKTHICFFKKDDWQEKPVPFLLPVVKHAIMLNKLHLADSSALDGAISQVRIWKLGDPDRGIYPTDAAVNKLDTLLRANVGGGAMDLIWGPDIDLLESSTDLLTILGEEKYIPHLQQIYEGLGIPSSLIGAGNGTTNNYISLKIMMKRLQCGRFLLQQFWQAELDKVQKALRIKKRASVDFDYFDIGDEDAERQFLLNLVDRDIISEERLHNILGFDPDLERSRIMKEIKERDNDKRPKKASPYHDVMFKENLEKIALQRGYMAPSQLGLVPEEGTENDIPPFDKQINMQSEKNKSQDVSKTDSKGGPGGRPPGAKDKEKRKTKKFSPQVKAAYEVWSSNAQKKISDKLKPAILAVFNKKNFRELTAKEIEIAENIKFGVLSKIEPFTFPSDLELVELIKLKPDVLLEQEYMALSAATSETLGRDLSLDETKQIQTIVLMENFYENL